MPLLLMFVLVCFEIFIYANIHAYTDVRNSVYVTSSGTQGTIAPTVHTMCEASRFASGSVWRGIAPHAGTEIRVTDFYYNEKTSCISSYTASSCMFTTVLHGIVVHVHDHSRRV